MIKAIIFDLGGVILDMGKLVEHAVDVFRPQNKREFWKVINEGIVPVSKGKITLFHFWKGLAKRFGKKIPDKVLRELWIKDYADSISINRDVEKIVRSLGKTYKLGIISNTIDEHMRINRKMIDFSLFDAVTLSYQVKMAKNNKKIFLLTAKKLGAKIEECIFIDDIRKFADVAKSAGMKAILFKNPGQLKSGLIKLGIKV